MMKKCKGCTLAKHRSEEEKSKIEKRLNIIEGQIKGIKQMIDDDRCCDDVLIQISAVSKSLKSLGNSMLKSHLELCLAEDLKNKEFDSIDDVIELLGRIN